MSNNNSSLSSYSSSNNSSIIKETEEDFTEDTSSIDTVLFCHPDQENVIQTFITAGYTTKHIDMFLTISAINLHNIEHE
eukprot:8136700-Ditylum_brightwellii.AAC.1